MPKLSEFYVDAAALAGQWHVLNWGEWGPADTQDDPEKLYGLIGSTLSEHYQTVQRDVLSEFGKEATEYQIETECIARGLLLGWKNYLDDAGADVPYSVAESVRIMSDPRNAGLRAYIRTTGNNPKRLRDAHLDRIRKN